MKWQELFIDDRTAYNLHNNLNYVYNKYNLIKSQDVACSPVGIYPTKYPICVKPIYNLYGGGRDILRIESREDYEEYLSEWRPSGMFWMPMLKGKVYSVDILFNKGKVAFIDAFKNETSNDVFGLTIESKHSNNFSLGQNIVDFLERYIKNYTGPINIKLVNNVIINIHLRWNKNNFIWQKRSEYMKCIPIWLDKNTAFAPLEDDICYISCYIERGSDETENQKKLMQYRNRYKIKLEDVSNLDQQEYLKIGVFIISSEERNEISEIKMKNNWI